MKQDQALTTQTNDLAKEARLLVIQTPQQVQIATEFLSRANKTLDVIEKQEIERTYRLKEQIKLEQAPFIAPKKTLKEIIATLREKLSTYQTKETNRVAEQTQKLADRVDKGTLKVETAVKKMGDITTPDTVIEANSGTLTFRAKPTLKITHLHLIPRAYLIPNEDAIFKALQAGTPIPGAEIIIIQTPVNKRGK